jgi:hypothetical protein
VIISLDMDGNLGIVKEELWVLFLCIFVKYFNVYMCKYYLFNNVKKYNIYMVSYKASLYFVLEKLNNELYKRFL